MHREACDVPGYSVQEAARRTGLAPPAEEKGRQLMLEHDCSTNPHRLQVFNFPESQGIMVGASGSHHLLQRFAARYACRFVEVLSHSLFELSNFLTLVSPSPRLAERSTLTAYQLKSTSSLLQNYKYWGCYSTEFTCSCVCVRYMGERILTSTISKNLVELSTMQSRSSSQIFRVLQGFRCFK